jgi:divalent metal cation (Fe/Co/Zn/Cd) transporter
VRRPDKVVITTLSVVAVSVKGALAVLEANGKHLLADVWTSIGVLVVLGLVHFTGQVIFDPVLALLFGAHIAKGFYFSDH